MANLERVTERPVVLTAGVVLLRVFVQAYLATAHVKPHLRARAYMRHVVRLLAEEESLSLALPLRGTASDLEKSQARREAIAMYRQIEPILLAALPPEM